MLRCGDTSVGSLKVMEQAAQSACGAASLPTTGTRGPKAI